MKVSLKIIHDGRNSYPTGELEFVITDDLVTIKVSDGEECRSISVSRAEFVQLLKFLSV